MSSSSYPPYVDDLGHGLQVPQIPAACDGATIMTFAVQGTQDSMQALVDKFLNAPAGGAVTYDVIGSALMLTYSLTQRQFSVPEQAGYTPDYETAFWIPLFARNADGSRPDRITFWIPYLFISGPMGMVTGREVWGFRKEIGDISMPTDPGHAAQFTAKAIVFDPLANTSPGTMETVVQVKRDGTLGPLEETIKDIEDFFKLVLDFWGKGASKLPVNRLELLVDVVKMLAAYNVPVVNLKQFRDAQDSTRACYQALIESPCTPTHFYGGGLLSGDYVLTLADYPSHQIAHDLGLPARTPIPVLFSSWCRLDFTAGAGVEVWKAATA